MTDIFEEWRHQRFIIAPSELLDKDERLVILTDYKFWADNIDAFADWCDARDTVISEGMTVLFADDITLMEFVLKWS
jgi:hypothetical protein